MLHGKLRCQTSNWSFQPLEICLKDDGGKEGKIITCMAAGAIKVVPSVTADLWPKVGGGVSERSVVSESAICSSSGRVREDSLEEREECWPWDESGGGESEVVVLPGAKRGDLQRQCEGLGCLCRCEGRQSAGGGREHRKGLRLKGTTEGGRGEEEASGVVCLCVCEAFTSSTLADKFWFPSWVWGENKKR